jgi:hypothetical protein
MHSLTFAARHGARSWAAPEALGRAPERADVQAVTWAAVYQRGLKVIGVETLRPWPPFTLQGVRLGRARDGTALV